MDRDLFHVAGIGLGGNGGNADEVMEASGEVAFEAAQRAFLALALGFFASEVGLGCGVVAGAGDRDHVQRPVELAVSTAVKAQLVALA